MSETQTVADTSKRMTLGRRAVMLLPVLLMFAIGAALVAGGVDAIDTRHHEFRWRTVRGFGPVAWNERGVAVFDGAEAVRWGVGLAASGTTLVVWGVGILGMALGRYVPSDEPGPLLIWTGRISLPALAVAAIALFPPWQPWALGFYAVLVVVSAVLVRGLRGRPSEKTRLVFPVLAVTTIGVAWFWADIGVGMMLGMFAAILGFMNLAIAVPAIGRAIFRR